MLLLLISVVYVLAYKFKACHIQVHGKMVAVGGWGEDPTKNAF